MRGIWLVALAILLGICQPSYASAEPSGSLLGANSQAEGAIGQTETTSDTLETDSQSVPSSKRVQFASSDTMANLPMVILTLIALIGLIFLLAWLARRVGGLSMVKNKDMEIVSSLSLGPRERATLIQVNNTKILLGVTTQTVTCLHTFEAEAQVDRLKEKPIVNSEFSSKLQVLLRGGQEGEDKPASSDARGDGNA